MPDLSETRLSRSGDPDARHRNAVARSLGWADESAALGEYEDALLWVVMVEALGHPLPSEYETKRRAWNRALAMARATGKAG